MSTHRLKNLIKIFAVQNSGETAVQFALFLGGVAVLGALLAAPILNSAAQNYADNKAFGIDRILTGSVEKTERYTTRKSVIQPKTMTICTTKEDAAC